MKARWSLVLIFAATVAVAFWPRPAKALPATGLSLEISPAIVTLSSDPGRTVTTDLRVRNAGNQTEHLVASLYKFDADDNGNITVSDPGPADDYFSWIHLSKTDFQALPNDWQTIKMTINLPKTAAFDYNFAILYHRAEDPSPQPGTSAYNPKIGSLVLLEANVPGAKRQMDVADFSVNHHLFEYLPTDFTVKFRNSGNVLLVPKATIFITNHGDNNLASLDVNPKGGRVLADSSRIFHVSWTEGFPSLVDKTDSSGQAVKDKKGNPVRHLVWDWSKSSKFRFGKYTAKLLMVYDNGQRDIPVEAAVSFFVIPWRLILFVALVTGIVAWGMYANIRGLIRRFKKKR